MWVYFKVSLRRTERNLNKARYILSIFCVLAVLYHWSPPLCGSPVVRVSAVYCFFLCPSQYSIHSNQCGLFSFLLLETISFSAVAAGETVFRNRQVILLNTIFQLRYLKVLSSNSFFNLLAPELLLFFLNFSTSCI